jgi:hypothetical protein
MNKTFLYIRIQATFSAARRQQGTYMFCNLYFVKNNKIANNSATTQARDKKINTGLESL